MKDGIVLGDKVQDTVSGVEGIVVARVEYLNGCIQFCVQPKVAKDAMSIDSLYIDEGQLRWIPGGINAAPPKERKGGPSAHAPRRTSGRAG